MQIEETDGIEEIECNHRFPPMVHSPTITQLANGRILVVWYAGSYEGAKDTVLVGAWREVNGQWGEQFLLVDIPGLSVGNPVLHAVNDVIVLFFVILFGDWWTDAVLYSISSSDGGETWTSPDNVLKSSGIMIRSSALLLRSGTTLLPAYDEVHWSPLIIKLSPDFRCQAVFGDTTTRGYAIQPSLVQLDDDSLLMYSRTSKGLVYASHSFNDGESWTASQPTSLMNPNSSIALARAQSGQLVLLYNPSQRGREILAVSRSVDGGDTWTEPGVLVQGRGEYSYPTLVKGVDADLHAVFSSNRMRICYLRMGG